MPKLLLPAGFGKRLGVGAANSGIPRLMHELAGDEQSFRREIIMGVYSRSVCDSELGIDGMIRDVAAQYKLTHELDDFLQKDLRSIKGNLAFLLDLTSSVKDSIEKTIETTEAGAAAVAGSVSAGAGTVAVEIAGNVVEVPIYLAMQAAYTLVAGILGYSSGTYCATREGAKKYLADMAKGSLALAYAIPGYGTVFKLTTFIDDKRPRIVEAAGCRAELWLRNSLRQQQGLESLQKQRELSDVIGLLYADVKGRIQHR